MIHRCLFILITLIFQSLFIQAEQIPITYQGETLYIEIEGVTNVMKDPDYGWYTYRRDKLHYNISVNPHIEIEGGHCVPDGYVDGQFTLISRLVTSWEKSNSLNRIIPFTTGPVDSIPISQGSGTIDYSAAYESMYGMYFEIHLVLTDPVPLCDTGTIIIFDFLLYPEPTASEFLFTTQANTMNGSQALRKNLNCNGCVTKGLPGFDVNMSTLLPVFNDVDYEYLSIGPDVSFSRHFYTPGISGVFGDGWTFSYEQSLKISASVVQYTDGTGGRILFGYAGQGPGYIEFSAEGESRKRLKYYPDSNIYDIYDPDRKLHFSFEQFSDNIYRLKIIKDLYDKPVTLGYQNGKIVSVTDASGRMTAFEYSDGIHCSGMTLPDGRTCRYQYQGGKLSEITDIYGNAVALSHDGNGFITGLQVNERMATFTYTANQGGAQILSSITNLDGNTTLYEPELISWNTYSQFKVTDPEGNQVRYHVDLLTGVTSAVEDLGTGSRTEYVYNDDLMLESVISPAIFTTTFEYDANKRLARIINPAGIPSILNYDTLDNLVEYTDAEGHTWKQFYNEKSRLTGLLSPSGIEVSFEWNNDGLLVSKSFLTGQIYAYSHDIFGNVTVINRPNGGQSLLEYDPHGFNLTGYVDPEGNRSGFLYDPLDRITRVTNPDGTSVEIGYDCCAPVTITDENGNTTLIERNALLVVTRIRDAEGHYYDYTLDRNNRIVKAASPGDNFTEYAYNSLGMITRETDPFGENINIDYNPDGYVSAVTDPSGNVSSFQWGYNGRLMSGSFTNDNFIFSRDNLDRISSYTNGRGQTIHYGYTDDGLLESLSSTDLQDSFSFDERNRLALANNGETAISMEYNELNSVQKLTYTGNRHFGFQHNLNNKLIKSTFSDGHELACRYDIRGRVVSMVSGTDSLKFEYDGASNLTSVLRSNGIDSWMSYDRVGRLVSLRLSRGQDTLMRRDFLRNSMGFVIEELRNGLLSDAPVFLAADTGGFFSQGNQVLQWQNLDYHYDSDGNLVTTGDNIFAAKYDELSRLTEWSRDDNAVRMEYFYDALGRVTKKQAWNGISSETYRYYYDDKNRLIEMTCPETLKEWKFYYSDRSLEAFQVNNNLYFYHFDHLGNTIALSDQNGIIVQTYAYDPWGKILEESGDIVQPFKFSGAWGVIHEDKFLYRMPFRFYDSYTGRFIQRDPAGLIDGVNLYRYAGNNPVNNIDPTGLYDLMTVEVDEYLEDPSLNRYEDQPEIEYDKQKEVDDLLYQNQRDIMWGKVEDLMCEAMRILVPGVSAGDSYSQGRPWYEVAMEYAKHIPLIKYPTHVISFFYYHGSNLQEVNKESNHSIPIINPNPHHVVQY